ncbi:cold shock domain-containing protein [Acidithiobacillus ferridurans]|nr:cold shock domain-containing protein [Acidithiobacillus ferridurans]
MENFRHSPGGQEGELTAILGNEFKEGMVISGVVATVDFYDSSKGFGFAEVEDIDSRIFIHAEKVHEFWSGSLKDGDRILCDLARGPKGLHIEKIHDIQSDIGRIESANCQIIRLFPDRGYGFAKLEGSDRVAFFHVSVFPQDARSSIYEGQLVKAEIGPDRNGQGYQIKQIVSIAE